MVAPSIWATKANPAASVESFKEAKRDRFMEAEELPIFFTELANDHWLSDESDHAGGAGVSGVMHGDWTTAANGWTDAAFGSGQP